jgi:hypothetical protein
MKNSKQIQIGLLGLVAVLLVVNLLGGFDGLFGGSDDASEKARQELTAENAGQPTLGATSANPAAATNPAANKPTTVKPEAPAGPTTTMEFEETEFDFGVIDEGEKVNHVYKFKNTGNEPLVITNAKGSCGCTVPQWPKEPIAPGAESEIKVEFNSKKKTGKQQKRVTIEANIPGGKTFLTIKGEVTPDPNAPKNKPATATQ